jgi:hypothetical protein
MGKRWCRRRGPLLDRLPVRPYLVGLGVLWVQQSSGRHIHKMALRQAANLRPLRQFDGHKAVPQVLAKERVAA